jgi:hypothetical protein
MNKFLEKRWQTLLSWLKKAQDPQYDETLQAFSIVCAESAAYDIDRYFETQTKKRLLTLAKNIQQQKTRLNQAKNEFIDIYYSLGGSERNRVWNDIGDVRAALEA